MKTDNNTISTKVESLEDNKRIVREKIESWNAGAQWQKEQLLPIIESHGELLEIVKEYYRHLNGLFYEGRLHEKDELFRENIKQAIEKANNIKP